jgi:hypothetical protein
MMAYSDSTNQSATSSQNENETSQSSNNESQQSQLDAREALMDYHVISLTRDHDLSRMDEIERVQNEGCDNIIIVLL